jgi:outer membrane protein assembly factor BamC
MTPFPLNHRCATLLIAAALLSGCGWLTGDEGIFRDRSNDYRNARLEQPLQIPPQLDGGSIEDALAIPPTSAPTGMGGEFQVPRPDPMDGNPGGELVRLQRLGDAHWILVEAEPGEVWPRVRQFLNVNRLSVARADAAAGVIESGWLQPQAEGAARERYRFRIEQGVQRGSSEVFVLQSAGEQWPQSSSNGEREGEMRRALAQFIADAGSSGSVSMLAQRGLDARGKVFLERRGEQPALRLELPLERAWASLESALPKAGFTVSDLNRSERQLWATYAPPAEEEEKRGWFGSLWHALFGEDEAIADDTVYLIAVEPRQSAAVRITIRREDGQPLADADAERLLHEIKGRLS